MKLIHIADLHLDSPMRSNLSHECATQRKDEILNTFERLVRFADENGVEAILIAGDLFDSHHVTKRVRSRVLGLVAKHPGLRFFYLAGNHDCGAGALAEDEKPDNLFLFSNNWTSYHLGNVVITGSENPDPAALTLGERDVNIVLLHGLDGTSRTAGERGCTYNFSRLRNKFIDYLALGHLHDYRAWELDLRATACYSGCLEGRGFDERGEKGYVLVEVDGKNVTHRFVPFASRTVYEVPCDITGYTGQLDLEDRVAAALRGIPASSLVRVRLTGKCPAESIKSTDELARRLEGQFFCFSVIDDSRTEIDPESYRNDISLKGEFVRRVLASDLSDDEKERVIACGFRALCKEEPEL